MDQASLLSESLMNSPEPNPEGPEGAEQELQLLNTCLPDFAQNMRQSLEATFATSQKHEYLREPLETLLQHIETMRNDVYRSLVGFFSFVGSRWDNLICVANSCRDYPEHDQDFLTVLKHILSIHGELRRASGKETPFSEAAFAKDTLLLLRSTYRSGINILNPQYDERLSTCLDANGGPHSLMIGNDAMVNIEMNDTNSSKLIYRDSGDKQQKYILRNGSMAIVGRKEDLCIGTLYKMRLAEKFKIPTDINYGSNQVSLGGIMIARDENSNLYFIDRRSRNNVIIEGPDAGQVVYTPAIIEKRDLGGSTHFDFGESYDESRGCDTAMPLSDSDSQ